MTLNGVSDRYLLKREHWLHGLWRSFDFILLMHVFVLVYFLNGHNKIQFLCCRITGNTWKAFGNNPKGYKKWNNLLFLFWIIYATFISKIHGFCCQQILFFLINLRIFHKTSNGTKTFYVFVCVWQHTIVQQMADIAKFSVLLIIKFVTTIQVVAPSESRVYGRLLAGIVGLSPDGGMDVWLWKCGVLRVRGACNELTTGLPTVVRRCVWSRNVVSEAIVVRVGPQRYKGKGKFLAVARGFSPL
jgi:hypothetical protein